MKKIICLTLFCLFLSSCSNYIARMHKGFDRDDRKQSRIERNKHRDNLSLMRKSQKRRKARRISSRTSSKHLPLVKRRYKKVVKRYKASDLNDNGSDGSLWSGQGRYNNFLFTTDEQKKNGDIIIIKVASALKNEITRELKHAFPNRPSKNKKKDEKAADPAQESEAVDEVGKVHDKISSVVLEEVRKDHLLLRGRKELIYKKRKRQIEIQALVSRRDVEMDDSVISDNIIEKNITILR
jgi:flagellar basal body L-ring protein FlgH